MGRCLHLGTLASLLVLLVLASAAGKPEPGPGPAAEAPWVCTENVTARATLARHKRYALEGSRWRVDEITYKISKYSDKLPKETVDKIIRKAFNIWSKATNLKFTQKKSGKVHIEIRFERGSHGDDAAFDGPGGQRAHAFFPGYGGDAHFDDDENWTLDQVELYTIGSRRFLNHGEGPVV